MVVRQGVSNRPWEVKLHEARAGGKDFEGKHWIRPAEVSVLCARQSLKKHTVIAKGRLDNLV